jgi:hypothetical protein
MSTPINIAITLTLTPPENLTQVTQQFTDLANAIEKIRGVQVPSDVVSSLREAQTGATDVTRAFRGITLEEFARQIPTLQNLKEVTDEQAKTLARLYVQNQLAGGGMEDLAKKAAEAASELGVNEDTARKWGSTLGSAVPYVRLVGASNTDLIATFGGTNAALKTAMSHFSQLPETIGLPTEAIGKLAQASIDFQTRGEAAWEGVDRTISEVATSTGRSEEEMTEAFVGINNTMAQSPQYASLFSRGLEEIHSQMVRTSPEYLRYRDYIRSYQAILGPLGYAFTQVGYQAYWLGIGAMFYAMSIKRQEAAAASLQSQMLQVVSAHERVKDSQEAMQRALVQYGPNSEQARKAAYNYVMAQKQVELEEKQVVAAAMQQKAAELMTYATLVPLFINAATFGMRLAAVIAQMAGYQVGSIPAAIGYAGANTAVAGAQMGAGAATGFHAAMVNFLKASWIPLIGIAAGVVAALATMAIMNQQMAQAEASARREMEEMNGTIQQQVYHLTGHSLYDSLLLTTQALQRFRMSLEEVPTKAIEIPIMVQTPEIPEARVERVTVPVQAQEVTIRPRVEMPRFEVPRRILELIPRVGEIVLTPRTLTVNPQVQEYQLSSKNVQVFPIVSQPRFRGASVQVTPLLTQTRFTFPRHILSVSPVLVGQPIVRPRIQTTSLEGLGLPVSLRTTRGQVFFVNIQFPNMVVRGTNDINLIAQAVEKVIVKQSTLTGMRYA